MATIIQLGSSKCYNNLLFQGVIRPEFTSEDEATLAQQEDLQEQEEALEISSMSSSQYSKSPASAADMTAVNMGPDLISSTILPSTATLTTSTTETNMSNKTTPDTNTPTAVKQPLSTAIFPTPTEFTILPSTDQNTASSATSAAPTEGQTPSLQAAACNIAAAAVNPNLNLQVSLVKFEKYFCKHHL